MPQHDMSIANAAGSVARADINNALPALASNSSGTSVPATTWAFQFFVNISTNKLYIRNYNNTDWLELPFSVLADRTIIADKVAIGKGSGVAPTYPIDALQTSAAYQLARMVVDHLSYSGNMLEMESARASSANFDFTRCQAAGGSDIVFRVRGDGEVYADGGTAMNTPADYAEMFEWADGNPKHHDRVGLSVVLEDGLLREAVEGDDPIGIISGNPAIIGDAAWGRWAGKYEVDDFNRIQIDGAGARKLAKDYDPEKEYTPRQERPEWSAVGLLGKLRLRKGQVTGSRWVKLRAITDDVEEWLVR